MPEHILVWASQLLNIKLIMCTTETLCKHPSSSLSLSSGSAMCIDQICSVTRQVVWSLELVGDVTTLKNFKDQVLTLRLHFLLQGNLYLSHYLGLT